MELILRFLKFEGPLVYLPRESVRMLNERLDMPLTVLNGTKSSLLDRKTKISTQQQLPVDVSKIA